MNKYASTYRQESVIATNTVLRNTYLLLSMTLVFSAFVAWIAVSTNAAPLNIFVLLLGYLGLPMLIQATRNSAMGLVSTFLYTGFVGWTLGPFLNLYMATYTNAHELIFMALGSTGLIFLGLSAIAMNPERDFSRWGSFLVVGAIVAIIASLVNIFFLEMPAFSLAISIVFALISGGFIMFQTNAIIHGGETNYISATCTLYISIINIFITLLQIFGMAAGNRD